MKSSCLFVFLFLASISFTQTETAPAPVAQTLAPAQPKTVESIYICGAPEASFPGGSKALKQYILDHFPADKIEREKLPIEPCRVYVSFVICYDGSIQDVEVVRGVNDNVDSLCIEFIRTMPNWIPASDRDHSYNQRVRIPISFSR